MAGKRVPMCRKLAKATGSIVGLYAIAKGFHLLRNKFAMKDTKQKEETRCETTEDNYILQRYASQ